MVDLLVHAAFATFAAQFFLFIIPLAVSVGAVLYAISAAVYTIFFESEEAFRKGIRERGAKTDALERARERAEKGLPVTIDRSIPKIKPLNCPNCAAPVPLAEAQMLCPNCSASFPVPREYEHNRKLRAEVADKLKRATKYRSRAAALTSRWVRALLILAAIWHIAVLPMLYAFEQAGMLEMYQDALSDGIIADMAALSVFTWLGWTIILLFTAFYIEPAAQKELPTLDEADRVGTAESTGCIQCGGGVRFEKKDIAAVCGYCGVENYRARLAWEIRGVTNNVRHKANFSLIDAIDSYRRGIEDILWTPVFLISLFITLPFFLIVVPRYIYTYLRDEHPFIGIAAVLALIAVAAFFIFRSGSRASGGKGGSDENPA